MNYAGAIRAPIQNASVCTQTDVSWVGAQPVTRKQRPAAPVNSRSVPSVSRSVADVKKTVAPAKLSPLKKGEKTIKPSSPKQQVEPVHESDAYFTVKTHKGKSKESSPGTSVHISPIKFKERLKRSYQASDFFTDILRYHPVILN